MKTIPDLVILASREPVQRAQETASEINTIKHKGSLAKSYFFFFTFCGVVFGYPWAYVSLNATIYGGKHCFLEMCEMYS